MVIMIRVKNMYYRRRIVMIIVAIRITIVIVTIVIIIRNMYTLIINAYVF